MSIVEVFEPDNSPSAKSAQQLKSIVEKKPTKSLFPVRDNEPGYAKLDDFASNNKQAQQLNRYGNSIPLVQIEETVSLNINGVDEIGPNPNRNKQHAFHFTADNCIGCHACESACSEKNDLPAHLSFRSVGYVESGSYPNYTRMNISMACNHCDDPVCLKGCPTRAYTKHAEYGAVIQDPDICFGCGYCTWVCPYNAPQLDPVAGQVEKCNMCVDRLEVGLKPACVAACVGNALNFGVSEDIPINREDSDTQIPGFPDPSITKPNIRFQQSRVMPTEVTRTDSMPIKYRQEQGCHDSNGKKYTTVVDQKHGTRKHWNLTRLSSRENPLVIFTLFTQTAIGIFFTLFLGKLLNIEAINSITNSIIYAPLLLIALSLVSVGLLMSTLHLGKPIRFYRGFNNLRHSPLCREGLSIVIFIGCLGLHFLSALPDFLSSLPATVKTQIQLPSIQLPIDNITNIANRLGVIFEYLALPAGLTALYFMYRCYCIKARPFWNHWQTAATFYGNMLSLGALITAALTLPWFILNHLATGELLSYLGKLISLGLIIESCGLAFHAKAMSSANNEGAASHYQQTTTFGLTYSARNILMAVNLLAVAILTNGAFSESFLSVLSNSSDIIYYFTLSVVAMSIISVSLVGRALFYVLVIPTTMPGAFFWKNKAFEQHARDTGLAKMPQVGVVA